MYKDVILWHQQLKGAERSYKGANILYVIEVKLL